MPNNLTFPKYLSIQTTSLCNASCVFCPYEDIKNLFPHKIMDMLLYKKIIDECSSYSDIERIILYMNNEPLTDPNLIERINYAKEKVPWASVHILTNGLLLTDEISEKLLSSRLNWIGISFHGIRKETVEKSMKISYETALGRINKFIGKVKQKKDMKDYLMITFLKHQYLTLEEKEEVVSFWKAKGVERISYFDGPVSRGGNVSNLPKVYRKGKVIGCNSIWADEMIHIVEDGKVILCCMDWKREMILGDLNKESIYEVWNGRRKKTWEAITGKRAMSENFLCRRCEEAQLDNTCQDSSTGQHFAENARYDNTAGQTKEDLIIVMVPPWQTKMVPLGMAYLSEFLLSNGINTKLVDLNAELFNSCAENKKFFWNISTINTFTPGRLAQNFIKAFRKELEEFVDMVCSSSAKLVGFSTTIASINVAVYLAHCIKLRDSSKVIILGGPGCFWDACKIDPQRLIDVFVVGEGELPLLEIMKRFQAKKSVESLLGVPGTIICLDKTYRNFLPPNHIKNINEIPFPTFKGFNLGDYSRENMYKPIPLLTSRGCINHCSFCVDHKMNYPYRFKDPSKLLEEIKFYVNHYGVKEFEFNDLLCNGNLKQLEAVCDRIINENMDVKWSSYAAIRKGMNLELCEKMRKAGCRYICYGMESASDMVLRKMNKKYNSRLAEEIIQNTYNAGIETSINIIIGHPGESEAEFRKTCKFVERNKDYIDQVTNVSTCFLIPESDLIKNFKRYKLYFKSSWKNYVNFIFGKKRSLPNYKEFYTFPGNTPSARARRMRRFLNLLKKLNIPHVIINYEKKYDLNLNKFLEKIGKNVNILKYRHFKLDFSQKGKCKLYFRNVELTSNVGMNTSFNIDKQWCDSSSAKWKIRVSGKSLDMNLKWMDFPVVQQWRIKFTGKYTIDWEVKTQFNSKVDIFQYKMGMIVSNKYNKYTFEESVYSFPNLFTNNWEQILFLPLIDIALTAGMLLPDIVLKGEPKKTAFSQLQNSPFSLHARMFNVCHLMNANHLDYNNKGQTFNRGDILEGRLRIHLKA